MSLFQFYFFEFTAIYILVGWSIYLMFRIDQPYFGSLYSMLIGAYFAAYTSSKLGWPFVLIMIGAVAFCVLFSLIPAFKLARLGGFPMLIATMALFFIVLTVFRNMEFLGARHGLFGIQSLPKGLLLGITYCFVVLIGFFVYRLDHSHIGRAMDAFHFDQSIASSLGINTTKLSIQLQLISSAIGAVAGVLYAFAFTGVFPEAFGFSLILYGITIVVFGGMFTMWGTVIASPVLWGISQFLPEMLKSFSNIIYAVLLIVMLLIRPNGIIDRKIVETISRTTRSLFRRFHISKA